MSGRAVDYETILVVARDGLATITLNRPEVLNALNCTMARELIHALHRLDRDDEVRAIIVTGAGRAFCAGADLSEGDRSFTGAQVGAEADAERDWSDPAVRDLGGQIALRIFRCVKPVIAAVNGAAVGVGATMLLPMDVRIAAEGARFGFVFVRRGIVPEAASSWFLPRLVGISRAMEWCCSGALIGADEAASAGLVRSIHPVQALPSAAAEVARAMTRFSAPVSVALTRQMLWRMLGADHPMAAHRIDSRAVVARSGSADAREGMASFFEKRDPQFADRISTDMPDFYPFWEEPEWS